MTVKDFISIIKIGFRIRNRRIPGLGIEKRIGRTPTQALKLDRMLERETVVQYRSTFPPEFEKSDGTNMFYGTC